MTRAYEDATLPRAERIASLGYDYGAQEKAPVGACNLCGGEHWTVLTERDRYGFGARATACWRCSLVVLNPRMTVGAYARFYDSVYRPLVSAFHGRRIDAQTIKDEQREYALQVAEFVAPHLGAAGRATLLDVGGSTGVVSAHFVERFGLKAVVIDPAAAEIKEAAALGIETVSGFVEDWQPGGRRFQVVGMFQTVDHLLDVSATLRKLRDLITPDGVFVVDIVDFRAAYLRNWSVEMAVKIDHPFSLTEETMEAYLARAGFAPVQKVYSGDHLHIVYVCRPCDPAPGAMPPARSVADFFREVRFVQNAPGPSGGRA